MDVGNCIIRRQRQGENIAHYDIQSDNNTQGHSCEIVKLYPLSQMNCGSWRQVHIYGSPQPFWKWVVSDYKFSVLLQMFSLLTLQKCLKKDKKILECSKIFSWLYYFINIVGKTLGFPHKISEIWLVILWNFAMYRKLAKVFGVFRNFKNICFEKSLSKLNLQYNTNNKNAFKDLYTRIKWKSNLKMLKFA